MSDIELAAGTAFIVVLIFVVAFWAQRRQGPVDKSGMASSIALHGKDWVEVFDGRLATIEERQKNTDHDVRNIRAALAALPSKDAVHRVEVEQARLAGKVETVETVVVGTQRAVDRIENHLLSGTKDK